MVKVATMCSIFESEIVDKTSSPNRSTNASIAVAAAYEKIACRKMWSELGLYELF